MRTEHFTEFGCLQTFSVFSSTTHFGRWGSEVDVLENDSEMGSESLLTQVWSNLGRFGVGLSESLLESCSGHLNSLCVSV